MCLWSWVWEHVFAEVMRSYTCNPRSAGSVQKLCFLEDSWRREAYGLILSSWTFSPFPFGAVRFLLVDRKSMGNKYPANVSCEDTGLGIRSESQVPRGIALVRLYH